MKTLIELVDAYARNCFSDGVHDIGIEHPHTEKARAALVQAIDALQRENAELQAENAQLNDDVSMHMRVAVRAVDEVVELKAEVERLKEENSFRLESEKRWATDCKTYFDLMTKRDAELDKLKNAEPVAWMDDFGNAFPLGANKGAGSWMDAHKRTWRPLYAGAAPQAPAPLTDEQIADLHRDAYTTGKAFTTIEVYTYFARAIEKAHGITEAQL